MKTAHDLDIAITGIGVISPPGIGWQRFATSLKEKPAGIRLTTRIDVSDLDSKMAGEVVGFEHATHLSGRGLKRLDRSIHFTMVAIQQALESSRIEPRAMGAENIGIVLGASFGVTRIALELTEALLREGPTGVNPAAISHGTIAAMAGEAAIRFSVRGPSTTIGMGQTAGIDAVGRAAQLIRNGQARAVLCGGVEALHPHLYLGLYQAGELSRGINGATEAALPYDRRRNGFILGEGGAMLVIESLESARSRGVPVLALVRGYAAAYEPEALRGEKTSGVGSTFSRAIQASGLTPANIEYIAAGGNGSRAADLAEAKGLAHAFGGQVSIPVGCIKAITGDSYHAGGAMQVAAAVVSIHEGFLPPAPMSIEIDPRCPIVQIPDVLVAARPAHVLVSCMSRWGACAALVLSTPPAD